MAKVGNSYSLSTLGVYEDGDEKTGRTLGLATLGVLVGAGVGSIFPSTVWLGFPTADIDTSWSLVSADESSWSLVSAVAVEWTLMSEEPEMSGIDTEWTEVEGGEAEWTLLSADAISWSLVPVEIWGGRKGWGEDLWGVSWGGTDEDGSRLKTEWTFVPEE